MSVVELPKFKIDPSSPLSADEQSRRLHFKKNAPDRPELDDYDAPPYRYFPFPTCVYRDWSESGRQRELMRVAAANMLDLLNPYERAKADAMLPEFEAMQVGVFDADPHGEINPQLRARNERELAQLHEQGWADSPQGVRAAKDRLNKAIASAAAHRHYEDRNMGEIAQREIEAAEDASDDHLPTIPETPVRRGRKPRQETTHG